MKTRIIIVLSLFAILVLILIQFYSVGKVYNLKMNEFEVSRKAYIGQAQSDFNTKEGGLDELRSSLNDFSYSLYDILDTINYESDLRDFNRRIYQRISQIIYAKEIISDYIKIYLNDKGLDNDFQAIYIINEFKILYHSEEYIVYNENSDKELFPTGLKLDNVIQNNTRTVSVGDYYLLDFTIYFDYTHKQKVVLRETAGVILFAIISIIVVVFVFIYTFRNLMKEKKMSDLKTDFINNMTHELKTPLSTIAVASNSLAYENIIKDKSKILDISRLIGKQNKHLNQLINHILDISIWEKEQFKLNKKEIKLLPFLKEKVEAFRIKYQTEEIKINEEYKFNTISIELDEFQITTAINNLLNNAVKYSDNSAEVSIFCYIDKELVIEISDKGIGLNAEQQKQIFDKFYRANTGNIHNVKGLGLGLYYVKKIIEAHKGRIEVISKVGKGSTFTIYLPL
ncbi:sensor histidine kinase [Bacteroidota bacterium]